MHPLINPLDTAKFPCVLTIEATVPGTSTDELIKPLRLTPWTTGLHAYLPRRALIGKRGREMAWQPHYCSFRAEVDANLFRFI